MRLLLDTHIFLWMNQATRRLGSMRALLDDEGNDRLLSAAVSWEIGIKFALGRLPLPEPPQRWVPARVAALACTPLPVEQAHALAVTSLPLVHRDPFDRLLVATAQALGVPLLSADPVFDGYDVEVLRP